MKLSGQDRGVKVDLRRLRPVMRQAQDGEDDEGDYHRRHRREKHVAYVREQRDFIDRGSHHRGVGERGDFVAEVGAGDDGAGDHAVGETLGPADAEEGDADGGDGGPRTAGHHRNHGADDAGRKQEHLGTDDLDTVVDEGGNHAAHRPCARDGADKEEDEGGAGNIGKVTADGLLEGLPRGFEEGRCQQHTDARRCQQGHLTRAQDGVAAVQADVDGQQRDEDDDGDEGENRSGGGLFHIGSSYTRKDTKNSVSLLYEKMADSARGRLRRARGFRAGIRRGGHLRVQSPRYSRLRRRNGLPGPPGHAGPYPPARREERLAAGADAGYIHRLGSSGRHQAALIRRISRVERGAEDRRNGTLRHSVRKAVGPGRHRLRRGGGRPPPRPRPQGPLLARRLPRRARGLPPQEPR